MPATATHAFFAIDVYNRLDANTKSKLKNHKTDLIMFSQGTDPLMFYNIINLKKGKNIRNLQMITHTTKTNEFFNILISYIKRNEYYNNPQVLAFLYGFILHFSLDSNIHPFVFYKTGNYDKSDKSTLKYNCLHNYMETYFDNILIINKTNSNYKRFNVSNFCFNNKIFSKELKESINYTFNNTYHIKKMSQIYYTSLKQMKLFLNIFRKDKYAIKKVGYKVIDKVTPKNTFVFNSLSYNQTINNKNYLNNDKKLWNYPIDKSITSNKSFYELYNHSLEESLYIIGKVNDYFFNNLEININNLFQNRSYVTGINCNSKLKQKYFEF